MAPFARNMLVATTFAVLGATAQWATDVAATAVIEMPPLGGLVSGALAALFLSLVAGLAAGLAMGLVWAVSLGDRRGDEIGRVALRAAARWLFDGSPAEARRRAGGVLGVLALLGAIGVASFFATRELVIEWAQPHYIALAVFGAHVVFALVALLLFPFARGAAAGVLALLARIPGLGRLFAHAAGPLGVLATAALALAVAGIVRFSYVLSFLPWQEALRFLVALLIATALTRVLRSRLERRWWRRGLALTLAAVALVSGFHAITLSPLAADARRVLTQHMLASRLALTLLRTPLDPDGDGSMPAFGEGDCSPFDPRIHPGAVDIPGDGIDQDCTYGDLEEADVELKGRWSYPVRGHIPEGLPVILVTIDTLAASRTTLLGYDRPTTPNLERFAKDAVLFLNTFSQGPSTRLSFPALFTSRWDSQIARRLDGKHPYPIEGTNLTLAEVLRQNGYDTQAVIPVAYFSPGRWKGLTQGFNRVVDSPATSWGVENDHTAPLVTDAALATLQRPRTKPLFMWVHYFDPHAPHIAPNGGAIFGTEEADLYDAELAYTDREVGRLLRGIEAATKGEALVIVTGDHGIGFDEPRHARTHYGQDLSTISLHVPMLVRAPFVHPRHVDAIATTLDIAPTIVNLIGLRGPFPFEGQSLVPAIVDGVDRRPQLTFHQFFIQESLWKGRDPLRQISVRTDRYNLILNREEGGFELYDWREDYTERHNLVETDPELARRLHGTLMTWLFELSGLRAPKARGIPAAHVTPGQLAVIAHPPPPPALRAPVVPRPPTAEPPPPHKPLEPRKKPRKKPRASHRTVN